MAGYELDFRSRVRIEFHDRLEVWGLCAASSRQPGVSPTWTICQRLARAAGVVEESTGKVMLEDDIRDAAAIERAWATGSLDRTQKALLAGYYVHRVRPPVLCRALGVRLREFDQRMASAICALFEVVERLAGGAGIDDN